MGMWHNLAWLCLCNYPFAFAKSNYKLFETVRAVPDGWEVLATPKPDVKLSFQIALAPVSEIASAIMVYFPAFVNFQ
jgi:tripeptidyl-peptidase-1